MSVKALEAEFDRVYEQYHEMIQDIKDIELEVQKGIVEPEFLDRLKEQIKPIKQNYEWWSWVMFTLHEPQRKSKRQAYRERNKKLISTLSKSSTPNARLHQGQKALDSLKEMKNGRTS